MNHSLNHLVIYNGYPLSVAAAVGLHILLLAALIYMQSNNRTEVMNLVQPTVIKALFIDENPQVINQQNQERQRLERIEEQRLNRERELEAQRAEAARQAELQAQQEAERAALIERQELERMRAEQQRLEEQRRLQDEATRREQEQLEAQREQERQRQRDADLQRQQQIAAEAQAAAARSEFELVQSATAIIQQYVQEQWSRPPSARNGMRAVLRIEMLPTGDVTSVSVVQSSNDPAFDRSAETAIYRAAPFTELQQLPINVFNTNFRSLSLIFEPEDLLN